jgi:LPS-assembly protein
VRHIVVLVAFLVLAGVTVAARGAEVVTGGGPILFKADQLRHERKLGIVVGRGNVEITQGERVLRADTVSYNQRTDILTATGNVTLLEPTGDVVFADHIEISGDFKDGIVENIRVLLSDEARMAAVGGRRIGGDVMEMRKVVYSPCRECVGADGTPMWQLKAGEVVHNKLEQVIEYRDAFLELFGIPVLYTPYLSHPDPTVKRKSGFLTPRYGSDSQLGFLLETPYYFAIAPDKDATLRPIITTDEGPVLAGQYRQRFTDGRIDIEGSGTYGSDETGNDKFRGHLFSNARFDLTDTWRTGADIQLSSDDTYLNRYDFSSIDTLTNRLFVEGFRGQNYASAQGYYWRGLSTDDRPGQTPIVAPLLDFNSIGAPGPGGGHWTLDANMMALTRTDGTDSRRISMLGGWELPHIAKSGEVYRLYATLQTDGYSISDVMEPDGDTSSGFAGRAFPRAGLDWRYPFARSTSSNTQVIEPVAGIMVSPNGGNPDKIPNEDSQDLEFDDTNLFSRNRFSGLDRVEGGQRVYYGLQTAVYGTSGHSSAFIGQSYRLRRDSTFSEDSGLADHLSDLVGRVEIAPSFPLNLLYRFRLDKDDFSANRNELSATIGPKAFRINVDYGFFGEGSGSGEFGAREELTAGFSSQLTKAWAIGAWTRRDLQSDESLSHQIRLLYMCDCFTMSIDFLRTFTQDRDIQPSDSIFVRLTFKNLGEVGTAVGP